MAIVYDGPVLPDDLTTFVRQVPVPAQYNLNQIVPDVHIQSNRVDIGQITKTNRTARFRAYDGALHVNTRDTGQVTTVQLPPLSDSLGMGELERLKIEFARTGGTNQAAFVDAIYNDADTLTRYIQNRMELARGDLLTDGKFTMLSAAGEPVLEADFGVPGGNFTTAPVLWTSPGTADPLTDINNVVTAYVALNGYAPGGMYLNRTIVNNLLSNTNIRTATGTILGAQTLVTRATIDQLLTNHTLPPILGVYDSQVDVDGTTTRILPINKVIFVPPADQPFARTVWGVSATALELVGSNLAELDFENAPGIVGVVEKDGPPYREFTFVDAVGMPVLDNPRGLWVLTVG